MFFSEENVRLVNKGRAVARKLFSCCTEVGAGLAVDVTQLFKYETELADIEKLVLAHSEFDKDLKQGYNDVQGWIKAAGAKPVLLAGLVTMLHKKYFKLTDPYSAVALFMADLPAIRYTLHLCIEEGLETAELYIPTPDGN